MSLKTHDTLPKFLQYLQYEKRYSQHTVRAYSTDLEAFFNYLDNTYGEQSIEAITHFQIKSWLAAMHRQGAVSRTLNRRISTLKSFFTFLMREGLTKETPMVGVISPRNNRRLPAFINETDTAALVKGLESSTEDWKSLNKYLLILLFYSTGMRLSELTALREDQWDEKRGEVKVLGKGNKERVIPVGSTVINAVREYIALKKKEFGSECASTLLVTPRGKKMYPKYAYLLVKEVLGDISTLDRKSPHVLRHSFATHLVNNGADLNAVRELLGHSSLAATQVYTHNSIDKLKDVFKKAHPRS